MKAPRMITLQRARLQVLLAGSVLSVDNVLPLPRKYRHEDEKPETTRRRLIRRRKRA